MSSHTVAVIASLAVGAVFLVSGMSKVASPAVWRSSLSGLGLPSWLAAPVPAVELVVGALLAAQWQRVVMAVIAWPHLVPIPRVAWPPLILSAVSGGIGQAVFARAYEHGSASRLAAFNYSGVLFTYLLELALFHRVPEPHQWLGAGLVVGAGVFVSLVAARRAEAVVADRPAP